MHTRETHTVTKEQDTKTRLAMPQVQPQQRSMTVKVWGFHYPSTFGASARCSLHPQLPNTFLAAPLQVGSRASAADRYPRPRKSIEGYTTGAQSFTVIERGATRFRVKGVGFGMFLVLAHLQHGPCSMETLQPATHIA